MSHRYVNGVLIGHKYSSFWKRSPDCKFLRTEIYCIRVDGQKWRFSNMMMSKLWSSDFPRLMLMTGSLSAHNLCMFKMWSLAVCSVLESFCVLCLDVQIQFRSGPCGRGFFQIWRKKSVFKNIWIRVDGALV